jgi:hypothetical protein
MEVHLVTVVGEACDEGVSDHAARHTELLDDLRLGLRGIADQEADVISRCHATHGPGLR